MKISKWKALELELIYMVTTCLEILGNLAGEGTVVLISCTRDVLPALGTLESLNPGGNHLV